MVHGTAVLMFGLGVDDAAVGVQWIDSPRSILSLIRQERFKRSNLVDGQNEGIESLTAGADGDNWNNGKCFYHSC